MLFKSWRGANAPPGRRLAAGLAVPLLVATATVASVAVGAPAVNAAVTSSSASTAVSAPVTSVSVASLSANAAVGTTAGHTHKAVKTVERVKRSVVIHSCRYTASGNPGVISFTLNIEADPCGHKYHYGVRAFAVCDRIIPGPSNVKSYGPWRYSGGTVSKAQCPAGTDGLVEWAFDAQYRRAAPGHHLTYARFKLGPK